MINTQGLRGGVQREQGTGGSQKGPRKETEICESPIIVCVCNLGMRGPVISTSKSGWKRKGSRARGFVMCVGRGGAGGRVGGRRDLKLSG